MLCWLPKTSGGGAGEPGRCNLPAVRPGQLSEDSGNSSLNTLATYSTEQAGEWPSPPRGYQGWY